MFLQCATSQFSIGFFCRIEALRFPAGDKSLSEVFNIFALIHRVTTDAGVISRITLEVLQDFAQENVIYVELRTTPKVRSVSAL